MRQKLFELTRVFNRLTPLPELLTIAELEILATFLCPENMEEEEQAHFIADALWNAPPGLPSMTEREEKILFILLMRLMALSFETWETSKKILVFLKQDETYSSTAVARIGVEKGIISQGQERLFDVFLFRYMSFREQRENMEVSMFSEEELQQHLDEIDRKYMG